MLRFNKIFCDKAPSPREPGSRKPRCGPRQRRRRLAVAPLLAFFALSPLSAQTAWLTPSAEPLGQQVIGDTVTVQLAGVPASRSFEIVLEDEAGEPVAVVAAASDAAGRIAPTPVWFRSGVVGCDALHGCGELYPDPGAYRFSRFEEAEDVLAGRTFTLRLLEAGSGTVVAETALPLVVGHGPRFFFSDGSGCPRSRLGLDENVFLGAVHLAEPLSSIYVFLVADRVGESDAWIGAPFSEVRSDYRSAPQVLQIGASHSFTEWLWSAGATAAGDYGLVVRDGAGTAAMQIMPGDWWREHDPNDGSVNGLTIEDVSVCLPGGNPPGGSEEPG